MKWTASAKKLATEWLFFDSNRQRLVEQAEGKYALVKGRKVFGFFESERDALDAGYRRFGRPPFLVKKVLRVEVPLHLSSNLVSV
jgi:hypothetical protein